MVQTLIVKKKYPDEKFDKTANGKHFGRKHYDKVIRSNTDCYWIDDEGNKRILFKFRKKAMNLKKEQLDEIRNIYEKFGKSGTDKVKVGDFGYTVKSTNNNGFYKSGSKIIPAYTRSQRSKISGFYDRASVPHVIKRFRTTNVCRTTRFTRDHFDKWQKAVPMFEKIGSIYKQLAPTQYKKQIALFKKSPRGLQIGKSPYTTVTSNYNWRTACHKDQGDFEEGLGNLTILGDDTFEGGYLGFPQFKVAVDVKPLDVIIMDVHQWHCNTELKCDEKNVRLSFVCYYRRQMLNCDKSANYNGEKFFYKSENRSFQKKSKPRKSHTRGRSRSKKKKSEPKKWLGIF